MKKIIYIIGKPGSGKGTLAQKLSDEYDIPILSSNILFEYIQEKLPNYEVVEDLMKKGEHVPNEIFMKIIEQKIKTEACKNGFIIDGFPYNYEQALLAKEMLKKVKEKLSCLIYLKISDDVVIKRLKQRKICPLCKISLNERVCPTCKMEPVPRIDDSIDIINKRIRLFKKSVHLILKEYEKENIKIIDANQSEEKIYKDMISYLS